MAACEDTQQDTKNMIYKAVQDAAERADVFGAVCIDERGVCCEAKNSAEPAWYRVSVVDDAVWISLETADRWLSGSIEADLVNTGDKLDELIEEEVVDLGHVDAKVSFEHLRSDDKLYIFRSKLTTPMDDPKCAEHAGIWLLGYELVFRELGDMDESIEE